MTVALIGYGKMGHEVEKILLQMDIPIGVIIDNDKDWSTNIDEFKKCNVAIEFSSPDAVISNFKKCIEYNIPLVSGTTGWYSDFYEIIDLFSKSNSSFIYGSNFSIGANLFFASVSFLSKLMNQQTQYQSKIDETHHLSKKDKPSGTAISTAQFMLTELKHKSEWVNGQPVNDTQLPIYSHRVGDSVGEHIVTFSSDEDSLRIIHQANNRVGFAVGAVKSAVWLVNHPGIYNISEIFMKI
jgi:4-hydroxy-tetrahydrodipicolinate reductase